MDTALDVYNLFANWGNMSPGQKSIGLATAGIKGFSTAAGKNLMETPIITAKGSLPGLNVGQAVQLLGLGINSYSLIKNWDQMNGVAKLVSGSGEVSQMINTAHSFGLIGKGTQGAQVLTSAAEISNAGFSVAPSMGVGAIQGPVGSTLPNGYVAVVNDGATITAVPKGLEMSAQAFSELSTNAINSTQTPAEIFARGGASSTSEGSSLAATNPMLSNVSGALGAVGFVAGAKQVIDGWGMGGQKGRLNGAIGGTAMAAGLYAMGASSMMSGTLLAAAATGPAAPFVLAGVVVASILSNAIATGKPVAQNERDAVRDAFRKNGLITKDSVTLANGSLADIGMDGNTGTHEARDPSMLTKDGGKGRSLYAYECDYTNDLDFAANMGTQSLATLLAGGKAKNVDQIGGQLGNAAISQIGFGKDMTKENFETMSANVRAMYAKSGITSKKDAYAISNQAFSEGRINETQLVTMQQSFNMLFDPNGYAQATNLLSGRHNGIRAAQSSSDINADIPNSLTTKAAKTNVEKGIDSITGNANSKAGEVLGRVAGLVGSSKTPANPTGKVPTQGQAASSGMVAYSQMAGKQSYTPIETAGTNAKSTTITPRKRAQLMNLNRDDARKRNRSVYGASLING
jgi:hypothetical protein